MRTEDYVSFEVAKQLKEKGYNNHQKQYFFSEDISALNGKINIRKGILTDMFPFDFNSKKIYAPSLWDAQKWLREKHNLNIQVDYDSSQLWGWSIHECNIDDMYIDNCSMYNTYEQALNEGIKEALKLI